MNLTDTFYVALCMTILILGVVYWFWTQNQYIQRKLNLLDNIVFEIKTQIHNDRSPPPLAGGVELPPTVNEPNGGSKYPPAPSSELGDDEDLLDEMIEDDFEVHESSVNSPTLKINDDLMTESSTQAAVPAPVDLSKDISEDDDMDLAVALQPGGVGSGIQDVPEADVSAKGNVLEGMTLKELQRLAEQKGIHVARSMRKPALIEAIRAHSRPSPFEIPGSGLELS